MIGGEVLRRYRVTVDYSRSRITFLPTPAANESYEATVSGVSLAASGAGLRTYTVRAVVDPSPATEAGVRVGDKIISVDGRPAATLPLDDLRTLLRRVDTKVRLMVERDGKKLPVVLKTRRLVAP